MRIYNLAKYLFQTHIIHKKLSISDKRKFGRFESGSEILKPYIWVGDKRNFFIGSNSIILEHSRLQIHASSENGSPKIVIGDRCYLGYYLTILAGEDVVIGDDVLVASNVLITSENHGMDPLSTTPYMDQELSGKKVTIGSGSWIGEKVIILPGVSIGKKCVIGGGSVVTKSIPDYSIAVGNPARVIKKFEFVNKLWVSVRGDI